MHLAHAPAGQNHLIARLVARIGRSFDGTCKVDPRHMRIGPHQPAAGRRQAQTVFVVHGRIVHRHRYIPRRQGAVVQFTDRSDSLTFGVLL